MGKILIRFHSLEIVAEDYPAKLETFVWQALPLGYKNSAIFGLSPSGISRSKPMSVLGFALRSVNGGHSDEATLRSQSVGPEASSH